MALIRQQELSPKAVIYLLFSGGLCALAYALIFKHLLFAIIIMCLPLFFIIFIYSIQYPRLSFLVYGVTSYYFAAIVRYSHQEGLSVILDAMLVYMFLSILFYSTKNDSEIRLRNAFNALTGFYLIWILFVLIQFANPDFHSSEKYIMTARAWLLAIPILYVISSLLADSPKMLRRSLIVLGIFTITAFLKLLYQKYRWFDATEVAWLMEGNWKTHLLQTGIRYFSFFSDAGNFGSHMGMISIIYSIVGFNTRNRKLSIFYLSIAAIGVIGMLFSGTRGAIAVPMGGLLLYCLICKNIKVMVASALTGILLFSFFAFTNIGNDNTVIRRMRTAFQPQEDASFNVRKENQRKIADYLEKHPWGAGFMGEIPRTLVIGNTITEKRVPPDSFYVDIWIQTGYWGLIIYITIYAIIFCRGCYIIMFRIRNKELRNTLAALACGVFGIWINGYVGRGMSMTPSSLVIAVSLAFIMNGPYIDRQLQDKKNNL